MNNRIMKKLLMLLFFTICASQNCPSNEDIKPCICVLGNDKKPSVSCEGLSSADQLRSSINGMDDYELQLFTLTKSNIGALSADIFRSVEIKDLKITFTKLTSLSENFNRPPFLGQEDSLEYLEIRDSFTEQPLTRLSLSHLSKLRFLRLEGNTIPKIGNDWFESGPYSLKELHLLDTSTSVLGNHAFASLSDLHKLSLTGGDIAEVSRSLFPKPAIYLESLDLSDNKIRVTPDDLFSKMPSLREVNLESNDIVSINEVSFAPIWSQLTHVFFEGNPLVCDEKIMWIYKYRQPESLQGHCVAPADFKHKSLSNLTLSDFDHFDI